MREVSVIESIIQLVTQLINHLIDQVIKLLIDTGGPCKQHQKSINGCCLTNSDTYIWLQISSYWKGSHSHCL